LPAGTRTRPTVIRAGNVDQLGDGGKIRFLTVIAVFTREALAIEAHEAREAGALGYMARALVQATLPHSKPDTNEFERRNGAFTLVMLAPSRVGLPYGVIPRLRGTPSRSLLFFTAAT